MKEVNFKVREQEFLEQYLNLTHEIEFLTERISRMDAQAQKTVSLLNQLRVSGTLDLRRFETACFEEQELIDELANMILEKTIVYQEISSVIDAISNSKQKNLLQFRYLRGMKWKEVAYEMEVSEGHVKKLHRESLAGIVVPISKYKELAAK